jgi:hypothetical protein
MRNTGTLLRAALPLATIIVAACQDTSGPGSLDRLDATAALADYDAMEEVRQSAAERLQMAAPGIAVAGLGRAAAGPGTAPDGLMLESGPLISDAHRGKTFVYDGAQHRWVIDPARTGAPANGVRFITYEPRGAEPDATRPIGHADLIDLGDASAGLALRLVVVEGLTSSITRRRWRARTTAAMSQSMASSRTPATSWTSTSTCTARMRAASSGPTSASTSALPLASFMRAVM